MSGKSSLPWTRSVIVSVALTTACGVPDRVVSVKKANAQAGAGGVAQAGATFGGNAAGAAGAVATGGSTASSAGGAGTTAGGASGGSGRGGGTGGNAATAGNSSTGGSGMGGSGMGGNAATAGNSSTGGSPEVTCDPACSGATPFCSNGSCVACSLSAGPRCSGNAPELCVGGQWVKQALCGGTTPACSSGTCSGLRARGEVATVAMPPAQTGAIRVTGQQLGAIGRTCANGSSGTICVSKASIRP